MLGKVRAELKRLHDIIVWNYNVLEKEDADLRVRTEEIARDGLALTTRIDRLEVEMATRIDRLEVDMKTRTDRLEVEMKTRMDRLEAEAYLRQLKF